MKSIYILEPLTDKCINWVDANLMMGDYQPQTGQIIIEPRFVADILDALEWNEFRPQQDYLLF